MDEEKFNNMNYLLIDKADDWHYFRIRKDIADYLDMPIGKINGIITYCRRNFPYRHRATGIFIQQLFNDTHCKQLTNTTFIWHLGQRKAHWRAIDRKHADPTSFSTTQT